MIYVKSGFVLLIYFISHINSSHIKGSWNTKQEFFKFLIKFGFDKTDTRNPEYSLGYIYGNITSQIVHPQQNATFVLLDRSYFLEFYSNRSKSDKQAACSSMFKEINQSIYDPWCNNNKKNNDFLRRIPCPKGMICAEETSQPLSVVKGSQFTFRVEDNAQPRFWYVSLVACYLNTSSCKWQYLNQEMNIDYDIWLVNGNPNHSTHNPLVYQFSFDKQNTAQMYFLFFIVYCLLLPVQLYAVAHQRHPVTKLFTASLILEVVGIAFNLLDVLKYAYDGVGYSNLSCLGDILDILSRTTFMLLLILLAKGWAVTRIELSWKPFSILLIWFIYGIVHILLYVWNKTEVDIIEDIDEYQTWPGWLILILRTFISGWFLTELRTTMLYEHNAQKLNFFLHFGASALVWFIYLPIIALVALQLSALWRFKLLLGITYSADCLAYCMMTHLLWPTRSEQYFLLATDTMHMGDELDEFNEAPHIINTYKSPVYQPTVLGPDDYKYEYTKLSNGNVINS
ncbi:hypothetical protein M8J76_008819 [Diaphorina citri]|nr:hypothetical protein M8J76_008819 [Diaphorina citri]KAI5742482.1 hypothetical protein M8J77_007705 [Diaphorina citri]